MREQLQLESILLDPDRLKEVVRLAFPYSKITNMSNLSTSRRSINLEITIDQPESSLNSRVFKGKDAKTRAKKEEYFYRLITRHTDIPVPTVYVRDESKGLIDGVFVLESRLPGINLGRACQSLNEESQKDLAFQLGVCLAQIHSIKFKKYGDRFEDKQIGQFLSWKEYFLQFIRENLTWCSEQKVIPAEVNNLLDSYIEKWGWILDVDSPPCLVHQDFHLENVNILQTSENKWIVSGIYDFERGISGHNEWDFAKPRWAIFERYPVMREPMLEGYLKVSSLSDEFEERLNFYKAAESIDFWVFGTKVGLHSEVSQSIKKTAQQI